MTAIRIQKVFDDPPAVRALIERHGPYRALASYLPVSATRGKQATAADGGTLPWFRGTWAANGRPLVDGAKLILENPRFREAASRLFNTAEVTPNTVVVNINAPMPASAIHVDIPSFRGATRDRYPIQLLQAMGSSGLFESWRIVEAGAVVWLYEGPGGAYDYWPEGLNGAMQSERPPFNNKAIVADNDQMYHRIGWIGHPSPTIPTISPGAHIEHIAGSGWMVTDCGQAVQSYSDEQIRISILWKARVKRSDDAGDDGRKSSLTPENIAQIFTSDLDSRGIRMPTPAAPLSDRAWLNLVHANYYSPVERPE
jgi:hypothetical protein